MAKTELVARVNPYVGPRSFQKGEKLYGRARQTFEIVNLLIAERIVLLYAQPGAGKSSLLAAAVPPALEKEAFIVLGPIRPAQEAPRSLMKIPGFNRYAYSVMSSLEEEVPARKRLHPPVLAGLRLDDYFAKYRARLKQQNSQCDDRQPIALLIDQLEDVILRYPTDRQAKEDFFVQLGEALRDRNLYALLAIREDFIGALDSYAARIPTRLTNRYRLNMLEPPEAMQAIQQPARQEGVDFTDPAARKLTDNLRLIRDLQPDGTVVEALGPYVEPAQLQVVCRRLWERVVARQKKEQPAKVSIDEQDITAVGDIDRALADYYASQVAEVARRSKVKEHVIRTWFDEKLITPHGVRGEVMMTPEASGGLDNTVIHMLEQTYLVRAEKRGGATWFELAHDRLVKPVREDNATWFDEHLSLLQRQAKMWESQGRPERLLLTGDDFLEARRWAVSHTAEMTPAEEEFFEACQKAYQRIQRERRLNTAIRWLGGIAMILALIAGFFFIRAERAARIAMARQLAAESTRDIAVDPSISVLEALQAIERTRRPLPEAEDALRQAVPSLRQERIFWGHTGPIYNIAFSPDGNSIASASADGTVRIWNMRTGESRILSTHADAEMGAVAFSPDGKRIAIGGSDGLLQVLDAASGGVITTLAGHSSLTLGLEFSPDGTRLVSANRDGTAIVWDLVKGTQQFVLRGHGAGLEAATFSPDGKWIATASDDDTARLWDAATGKQVRVFSDHTADVTDVTFSPDGKWLATASADRSIVLWDVESGEKRLTISGHLDWVYTVVFTADGSTLISSSGDRTIRFWDTTYGRLDAARTLRGHSGEVFSIALSPNQMYLASAGMDGTVRLWNISPEGSYEKLTIADDRRVYDAAFSPDSGRIASCGLNKLVKVWDASTGQLLWEMAGHLDGVEDVAWNPAGTRIASGGRDGRIEVWDAATGRSIWNAAPGFGTIWSVVFSPDGKRLAAASNSGLLTLWDAESGAFIKMLGNVSDGVAQTLVYSPDGRYLAVTYNGESYGANIWEVESGTLAMAPRAHTAMVEAVAFSPDGKTFATSSDDSTVILWDISSGREAVQKHVLKGHRAVVYAVNFSPDGKYLASGGADTETRVWLVESGRLAFTLYGHTDRIYAVDFSPDGKYLATAGADRTVRVHYLQLSDLIQSAIQRVIYTVTPETCQQYLKNCPKP